MAKNDELRDRFLAAKTEAALAEADAHRAKAEHERSEAANVAVLTDANALELRAAQRLEEEVLAQNKYHHVYTFNQTVGENSVNVCIDQLTRWSRQCPGCDIEIVFNSPGGSIVDGMALFDYIKLLQANGHKITTSTLGMAASMAGILLQAGTKRVMGAQAVLLIHEASFGTMGKVGDVEDTLELVHKWQKRIVHIFAERSKLSIRQIEKRWKRKDWWIMSDEALELGLVDEIR